MIWAAAVGVFVGFACGVAFAMYRDPGQWLVVVAVPLVWRFRVRRDTPLDELSTFAVELTSAVQVGDYDGAAEVAQRWAAR